MAGAHMGQVPLGMFTPVTAIDGGAAPCGDHAARAHESGLSANPSKHAVGVGRLFGNVLNHIPMLDDFAVCDSENIDNGAARAAITSCGVHVRATRSPSAMICLISPC